MFTRTLQMKVVVLNRKWWNRPEWRIWLNVYTGAQWDGPIRRARWSVWSADEDQAPVNWLILLMEFGLFYSGESTYFKSFVIFNFFAVQWMWTCDSFKTTCLVNSAFSALTQLELSAPVTPPSQGDWRGPFPHFAVASADTVAETREVLMHIWSASRGVKAASDLSRRWCKWVNWPPAVMLGLVSSHWPRLLWLPGAARFWDRSTDRFR